MGLPAFNQRLRASVILLRLLHRLGLRARLQGAALILLATLAGCAHLGTRVEFAALPGGAPKASKILHDLDANDAAIEDFRGAGTFILQSPEFDAVKKFRGSIKFRRPADLYVQGNHRITNIPLFKLTCVGPEFLMEFPGSRDRSFYQIEGERYEDVPFSVSPSDIAREMFLPEPWNELRRRDARLIAFNPEENVATLSIGPRDAPRRRIEVTRVNPDDPAWVVVRNLRLAEDGQVIAETTLEGYNVLDGTLFPTRVDAWFPTEATRMTFHMRNIRLNTNLPDDDFDIQRRARELNLAGAPGVHPIVRETSFGRGSK